MNKNGMENNTENTCFSGFTIKINGGTYELKMRCLENWFQRVL